MRHVLCLVGVHHWEHHVNREMGGKGAGYELCARCGRERSHTRAPTRRSRDCSEPAGSAPPEAERGHFPSVQDPTTGPGAALRWIGPATDHPRSRRCRSNGAPSSPEAAGNCRGAVPDGHTLFVNIQASAGMTFAIWGPWERIGV